MALVQSALPYINPVTPEFVMTAINERDPEGALARNYIYKRLFPVTPVPEENFAWEYQVNDQRLLAGFYSVDGRPVPAHEIDNTIMFAKVAHLMASFVVDNTFIMNNKKVGQLIKKFGEEIFADSTISGPAQRAQQALLGKVWRMDDQIENSIEYLATSALQGTIYWPPRNPVTGGLVLQLDNLEPYWGEIVIEITVPIPALHRQHATTLVSQSGTAGKGVKWDDYDNSDPIMDLDVVREQIQDTTGEYPERLTLILSRKVIRHLGRNKNIIKAIRGSGQFGIDPGMIRTKQIIDYLNEYLDVDIIEYNAKWTYRATNGITKARSVQVPYINPDLVIIYPSSGKEAIGITATAPSQNQNGEFKPGKFAWTAKSDRPPFATEMGVGMTAFPAAQRWDNFFTLDISK